MNRGDLIVFEGPDGVGKTTMSAAVCKLLRASGGSVTSVSFPGKTPGSIGDLVYRLHHTPKELGVDDTHPLSLQMLHVAAHIDTIEREILPALRAGTTVVLDRFWWSTWSYGLAFGVSEQILDRLVELEQLLWRDIVPLSVILLSRDNPSANGALGSQHKGLIDSYHRLAQRESTRLRVLHVRNEGSVTSVAESIVASLASPKPFTILSHDIAPAKPTVVYDTFWRYAAERQRTFLRRLQGGPGPFSDDPIISKYRFTNAYRVLDRVSQFLLTDVIVDADLTDEDLFFRVLLFKTFNKIQTWQWLTTALGSIRHTSFDVRHYATILRQARRAGTSIYSAAYIMPSRGPGLRHSLKHRNHLDLIAMMMRDNLLSKLQRARRMQDAFELIRSYPMIGSFLAYQYIIDLNYTRLLNFSEMDFVVPGPGARDGIKKCFVHLGGLNEVEMIRRVAALQQQEFAKRDIDFPTLAGRPLQLIDCQNLFCEVDKYARLAHPRVQGISGRKRIKQRYTVNYQPLRVTVPAKWGLDLQHFLRRPHDQTLFGHNC